MFPFLPTTLDNGKLSVPLPDLSALLMRGQPRGEFANIPAPALEATSDVITGIDTATGQPEAQADVTGTLSEPSATGH